MMNESLLMARLREEQRRARASIAVGLAVTCGLAWALALLVWMSFASFSEWLFR